MDTIKLYYIFKVTGSPDDHYVYATLLTPPHYYSSITPLFRYELVCLYYLPPMLIVYYLNSAIVIFFIILLLFIHSFIIVLLLAIIIVRTR